MMLNIGKVAARIADKFEYDHSRDGEYAFPGAIPPDTKRRRLFR